MRALVTGAGNPTGEAIVRALLTDGHDVRLFGGGPELQERFEGVGKGQVRWHPGRLQVGGSIEPVLSQREVLIHCANLDVYGKRVPKAERHDAAVQIERGTLYTRYGAEREMVDVFIHIEPTAQKGDAFAKLQQQATEHVKGTRGVGQTEILTADPSDPDGTMKKVVAILKAKKYYGLPPGKQAAVTV